MYKIELFIGSIRICYNVFTKKGKEIVYGKEKKKILGTVIMMCGSSHDGSGMRRFFGQSENRD